MSSPRASAVLVVAGMALFAMPVRARPLDLPLRSVARPDVAAPAYLGEVISVRLRSRAAQTIARPAGPVARLGIAALDAAAHALGARFEPEFRGEAGESPLASCYLVHLPAGTDLGAALDRFAAVPEVESAEPVPVTPVVALPNDSLWSASIWFYQAPSRHDLHAPEAWDVVTGDSSLVVAIVDTGMLPDHPDLGGQIAGGTGQVWNNWPERGGAAGVDDDGNGFVDDTWGWDFVDLPLGSDVRAGEDGFDPDADPNDFIGHGTNVAGLVGAIANNGVGIAGSVWNVRLMSLRVGWATNRAPTGEVSMSFAAQAIRYATRMGADVINCSFSSLPYGPLHLAVAEATRAGVVVVAAAGNNGTPNAIGSREDVLSVASVDRNDLVSRFTNRGPSVDLAAPGEDLATTAILRVAPDSLGMRQPGYTIGASGTSFSAAFGSGAAALVQARRAALGRRPLLPAEMVLHLRETADRITDLNPAVTGYGTGRLNFLQAITREPTSVVVRGGARTVGSPVALRDGAGATRLAYVTSDARLVVFAGTTGDTLLSATLPGTPAEGLAAADMGPGVGTALFVGLQNGRVAGMLPSGEPLPGWPVSHGSMTQSFSGTALGDLDGDGRLEVVSVGSSTGVMAWRADGTPVTGFPQLGSERVGDAVALSDLDGLPGVEILAPTLNALVYALRGDGGFVPGWPVAAGYFMPLAAPVVTRFAGPEPVVVIADGYELRAVRANGNERFRVPLWNYDVADPALADLDGDGYDEIVVVSGPYVGVFDSSGTRWGGRWPIETTMLSSGEPVIGWMGGDGPSIALLTGFGLMGYGRDGVPLHGYPKPGFAGHAPLLIDADGDDATELVAGTGPDSLLYLYDLGAGSWRAPPAPWPTLRGNFARTGSRLYAPGLVPVDGSGPTAIADLAVEGVTTTEVDLRWTAPTDQPVGTPVASYELRHADSFDAISDFTRARLDPVVPHPGPPGALEHARITGLVEGATYYFAIRSRDRSGNPSGISNVVIATTARMLPGAVADLAVESVGDTSVALRWTASGDDGGVGQPRRYHVHATQTPIDEEHFDDAPWSAVANASVSGGGGERITLTGLPRGTRLWFAVRAEDHAGGLSPLSNVVSARTTMGGPLGGAEGAALASGAQPARAPVEVWWQASRSGETATQRIELYDVNGRRVRALLVGPGAGGVTSWDGRDEDGQAVPAGLYFARFASGDERARARIVLLR